MRKTYLLACLIVAGTLMACSNDTSDAQVLKAQTASIQKAEDVNQLVQDAAAKQREAIDQQSQ